MKLLQISKLIHATYLIFITGVNPQARKMWLWVNEND